MSLGSLFIIYDPILTSLYTGIRADRKEMLDNLAETKTKTLYVTVLFSSSVDLYWQVKGVMMETLYKLHYRGALV